MIATTAPTQRNAHDNAVTGGDLVLRVSGPSRNGQVVRLKAAKCTIGSSPHCTLRLRARGVSPLHCLLLRGQMGTVARCWSPDTLLNRQAFTDAALMPGDRLDVGPIALEVLEVGAKYFQDREIARENSLQETEDQRNRPTVLRNELDAERSRLAAMRDALNAEQDELANRQNALKSELDTFENWKNTLQITQDNFAVQQESLKLAQDDYNAQKEALTLAWNDFADRQNGLKLALDDVANQQNTLNNERDALSSLQEALQRARDDFAKQQEAFQVAQDDFAKQQEALKLAQDDVVCRQNALAEQRRAWMAERENVEHDGCEQRSRLESQWAEIHAKLAEIQAGQTALNAEREELENRRNTFAARQDDFEAKQRAAAEEKNTVQTQQNTLAEQQRAIELHKNALAEQERALEARQAAIYEKENDWEARQCCIAEEKKQLESQWHDLAEAKNNLEARQCALAEEQSALTDAQNALAEEKKALANAQHMLAEENNALVAAKAELAEEKAAWAEEKAAWNRERQTQSAAANPEPEAGEATESALNQEPQEPQFEQPRKGAPIDLADVFRRIGANVDLPEEESSESPLPSTPSTELLVAPTLQANAPVTSEHHEHEEESIDEYMGKLMQRVRAPLGAPMPGFHHPKPPRASQETTPKEKEPTAFRPAVLKEAETDEAAAQTNLSDVIPRASAPEKEIDWAALRELANLSAHNAITRYARRMLVNNMYSKLGVAAVALATGVGLVWMWMQLDTKEITFYSAIIAFFIAVYWGVQYALLTGRLIVTKSGEINIDWSTPVRRNHTAEQPAEPEATSSQSEENPPPPEAA